jgi:hypothetical protein
MTVKEYLAVYNKLHLNCVLDAIRPKNLLCCNSVDENTISYEDVKKIMYLLSKGDNLEAVKLAYRVDDIDNVAVDSFFSAKNWLINHIEYCIKIEQNLLKSIDHDDVLWKEAGGERLNIYNLILPLVQLGEIYNKYPYDLLKKPYLQIQTLLSLHKIKSEVTTDYNKLKNK